MKDTVQYIARQKLKGEPKFDIDDFKNITKPEIVYILGFLWADGHLLINRKYSPKPNYFTGVNFNILERDFKVLEPTFNKHMQWTSYRRKNQLNEKYQINSCIYDIRLAALLKTLDFDIKSYAAPTRVLQYIPVHLHYLFWRGYFDGDGCISIQQHGNGKTLNISSTYEQDWQAFDHLSQRLSFKYKLYRVRRKTGCFSCVEIYKLDDILKFCDYIYQNCASDNIGLTRKYNKYLELVERKKQQKPHTSKYTGISLTKHGTWTSMVWENNRYTYLGTYQTEEAANQARRTYLQK